MKIKVNITQAIINEAAGDIMNCPIDRAVAKLVTDKTVVYTTLSTVKLQRGHDEATVALPKRAIAFVDAYDITPETVLPCSFTLDIPAKFLRKALTKGK